ncbi:hypothetical protein F5148DRAFT_1257638 [Russula earlei]|uniref:Uncharacterized protein n=1 Tax=Russula earlei TaxID=71964 RepID=A0ACC0TU15_9AGAM|nr:hypothetical protein F5148DRAFT_1257638 [Russula earlei]
MLQLPAFAVQPRISCARFFFFFFISLHSQTLTLHIDSTAMAIAMTPLLSWASSDKSFEYSRDQGFLRFTGCNSPLSDFTSLSLQ